MNEEYEVNTRRNRCCSEMFVSLLCDVFYTTLSINTWTLYCEVRHVSLCNVMFSTQCWKVLLELFGLDIVLPR